MMTATTVQFLLDDEIVSAAPMPPDRTVLQWLREDQARVGTKEGCAEGDCGACTVVIAEPAVDGGLSYRAVNACIQFAPTLAGKALVTVESLSGAARQTGGSGAAEAPGGASLANPVRLHPGMHPAMHPVQQAMVDCHASQCGFCTPGFVMSLFALYKTDPAPARPSINDALSGNLCRCTGYRPIIDAAFRMTRLACAGAARADDATAVIDDAGAAATAPAPASTHWLMSGAAARRSSDEIAEQAVADRLAGLTVAPCFTAADGRRFHRPTRLAELARLRLEYPQALLLAGGTDIGLWVTKQYRPMGDILWLGAVPELARIESSDHGMAIGAGVTLSAALPFLEALHPALGALMRRFASVPVRNAATLVGNLANGSPIGDAAPALMALGATLTLRRGDEVRELALEAFYLGYMKNALREGEFIERVTVPRPHPGVLFRSWKVTRRFDQDISAVSAGLALEIEAGRVRSARLAFGGMDAIVRRATLAEQALVGASFGETAIEAAVAALATDFRPISDMRASAAYRMRVAGNLLRRLLADAGPDGVPTLYDMNQGVA